MSNSSEIGKETHHNCPSPTEDEDESLSLCDLPLIDQEKQGELEPIKLAAKSGSEDFDFGSVAASLDVLESEMCAADEVFFGGQILPFRHSISSAPTSINLASNFSRSESMDRNAGSRFQTASSTASSSRSSSTRSTASTGKLPNPICQKRESAQIRNQFHSFPSPKPYARASIAHRSNKTRSGTNPVFRLGLVRTPEIEIHDLKLRFSKQSSSLSRNSSNGGSENGKSVRKKKKKKKEWSLMSCKCTAEVVEPEKVAVKAEEKNEVSSSRHYRTFEWLKDLSHAVVLNDDSRLLN